VPDAPSERQHFFLNSFVRGEIRNAPLRVVLRLALNRHELIEWMSKQFPPAQDAPQFDLYTVGDLRRRLDCPLGSSWATPLAHGLQFSKKVGPLPHI
jgi:hypothetical protein